MPKGGDGNSKKQNLSRPKRRLILHLSYDIISCQGNGIKLDFQIGKTESAIAHESQSKKRFEYNARLKEYKTERERLLGGKANESV